MKNSRLSFRKHWSTLLLVLILIVFFVPQIRTPIQVFFQKLIAFSPSELDVDEQEIMATYQWELRNLNGTTRSLASSEGKVTLINLWATWCPPCIAEMPSMQALYDEYGDRVDFYFVSSENQVPVEKFLLKKNYSFPVYLETKAPPAQLQVGSIPTTFVISKSGTIVMKKSGVADWNSDSVHELLDRLLAEQ